MAQRTRRNWALGWGTRYAPPIFGANRGRRPHGKRSEKDLLYVGASRRNGRAVAGPMRGGAMAWTWVGLLNSLL